ncbi:hypothetical protein E2542_SST15064 [Spatholobus suberectus]|nr:hypothetical protein E2542_SST15064 [Spatholobus suberectus]
MQPIPFFSSHFYVIEGYLYNTESPKQREKPDMSIFKNAVQDCLSYDPPKVHKPSNKIVTNNSEIEKFSSLRIRNQLLTSTELREHFSDIHFVLLSVIKCLSEEHASNSLHYYEVNDDSPIVQDDVSLFDYNVPERLNEPALKDYVRLMSRYHLSLLYFGRLHFESLNISCSVNLSIDLPLPLHFMAQESQPKSFRKELSMEYGYFDLGVTDNGAISIPHS